MLRARPPFQLPCASEVELAVGLSSPPAAPAPAVEGAALPPLLRPLPPEELGLLPPPPVELPPLDELGP